MSFNGKVIYNPSGKAGEYSYWAANFYNGCSAKCEYCYNRKGVVAKALGGDVPVIKKSLKDPDTAIDIFRKELLQNIDELRKHGLFFNFVSDPCLPQTYLLNYDAILLCETNKVPVKLLTKQTWWLNEAEKEDINLLPRNVAYGFTLTGCDSLEPGAATNSERIQAMMKLHNAGFKTWASIEPIIDLDASLAMIKLASRDCDLFKIGLESGKKYEVNKLLEFYNWVSKWITQTPIYWKDSFLKQAGISRESLPDNCVTRDFNL